MHRIVRRVHKGYSVRSKMYVPGLEKKLGAAALTYGLRFAAGRFIVKANRMAGKMGGRRKGSYTAVFQREVDAGKGHER